MGELDGRIGERLLGHYVNPRLNQQPQLRLIIHAIPKIRLRSFIAWIYIYQRFNLPFAKYNY